MKKPEASSKVEKPSSDTTDLPYGKAMNDKYSARMKKKLTNRKLKKKRKK